MRSRSSACSYEEYHLPSTLIYAPCTKLLTPPVAARCAQLRLRLRRLAHSLLAALLTLLLRALAVRNVILVDENAALLHETDLLLVVSLEHVVGGGHGECVYG